ncbi:DUF1150 family protein [Hasllibacter sp. MH4015]|uniref:DUF1150 family protein n=1 Tax=Hasllibacter sp. MH4015 TaxID=2854029 RepID=UPI001CD31406|nr:DUF1150 family protein [Hasllibacter sp. MH4015]
MTDAHDMNSGDQRLVYIRKVAVADLPKDVQDRAEGLETLYAIGSETGQPLALVQDRKTAFIVARQNDFQPVSVH